VAVLSTIALFSQDLATIFSEAIESEYLSRLLAVTFIFVYLADRKGKMLPAVTPNENKSEPKKIRHIPLICGILQSTTSVLLYQNGFYTFTPIEHQMFAPH
jgi:hypothetical protein